MTGGRRSGVPVVPKGGRAKIGRRFVGGRAAFGAAGKAAKKRREIIPNVNFWKITEIYLPFHANRDFPDCVLGISGRSAAPGRRRSGGLPKKSNRAAGGRAAVGRAVGGRSADCRAAVGRVVGGRCLNCHGWSVVAVGQVLVGGRCGVVCVPKVGGGVGFAGRWWGVAGRFGGLQLAAGAVRW